MADRTAIRADTTARLAAAGVAGGNVQDGGVESTEEVALPSVEVLIGQQRFERVGNTEPEFRTETEIIILVQGRQATDIDPTVEVTVDTLIDDALTALFTDAAWVKQFEKILTVEVEPVFDEAGARPTGAATIAITVQYTLTYPPVIADALIDIHADFDMASPRNDPQSPTGPDGQIDATDDIVLPQ